MGIDRNERARQQFREAQQRRDVAQQLANGDAHVLDRFGKPITPGALVLWRAPFDMVCEVTAVTPVLDPRFPPGLVQLVVTMTAPVQAAMGAPQMGLVVVGYQHEPGHAALETPDVEGERTTTPTTPTEATDATDATAPAGDVDGAPV